MAQVYYATEQDVAPAQGHSLAAALVLGVDASVLLSQATYAFTISQSEIERAIPIEVNNSGHWLFNEVVDEIAFQFPDVPPRVIAAALTSREASGLLPSFSITSDEAQVMYVEWITSRDEKVCKICGPRDGRIYRIIDVMDIYPAHPNCRCRIERLGISAAMLRAGYELMPEAIERVAEGVLEQFGRVWARFA